MEFEIGYLLGFIIGVLRTWALLKFQEKCYEENRIKNCERWINILRNDINDLWIQHEIGPNNTNKKGLSC